MPSHNIITLNTNPVGDLPAQGHIDIYYNAVTGTIEAEDWTGAAVPFGTFGTSAPLENSLTYEGLGRALSANQGTILKDLVDGLTADVANKVDVEAGLGLSENSFTDAEQEKLSGLPTGADLASDLGNKASVESVNGKVPLAVHQVGVVNPSGLLIGGTISSDYPQFNALLGDTLVPAGDDEWGPTWSTDGEAVTSGSGVRLCISANAGFPPAVWNLYGMDNGDIYVLWQTEDFVNSPELGSWVPAGGFDSTGNPTVSAYTNPLVAGQMATSDAEPDVVVFKDAEDGLAKVPRLDGESEISVAHIPSEYGILPQAVGDIGEGDDTATIQAALDIGGHVKIPYKSTPYLISDRLVIKSNTWLDIDPGAVIREIAGNNVAMLINENPAVDGGDHDIKVTGGYWDIDTTGNPGVDQWGGGYNILRSDKTSPIRGIGGVMSFVGVERLHVSDLRIVSPAAGFTIQVAQCNNWRVDKIEIERDMVTISDGIHVNGPSSRFVIDDIRGSTGDDFIALNAWDWLISTPDGVQGTIENGTISNLRPEICRYGVVKMQVDGSTSTKVQDVVIENVTGFSEGPALLWGVFGDGENPENVATHGQIKNVVVRNVRMGNSGAAPAFPYRGYWVAQDVTLTNVTIEGAVIDDQFAAAATHPWAKIDVNCLIDGVTIRDMSMTAINPRSSIFEIACRVKDMKFRDCNFLGDGTFAGEQAYSPFTFGNATASSQCVSFQGCRFEGLPWLMYNSGAAADLGISMEGCEVIDCTGLIFAGASWNSRLTLSNNRFDLATGFFNYAAAGPALFVISQGNTVTGTPGTVSASAGSLRWDGIDIPVDHQVITATDGDWINNNNSAGATVTTGRVKRASGAWAAL